MTKYRDQLCIMAAILEAANSGCKRTRIMFSANLSFKLLEKYLGLVVGLGLVETDGSVYLLTERGHEFLRRYRDFNKSYAELRELVGFLGSNHEKLTHFSKNRLF